LKIQTKDLAVIAIYGALYVVLSYISPIPIYGTIQFRVANILLATIPLLGIAGVLGHTLGVFVVNMSSLLGPIDLLNTLPAFAMAFIVFYVYKHTKNDYTVIGTCIAYSVVLGVTVGWMLNYVGGAPLILTMAYVTTTNIMTSVLIGWPVFKILKRSGVFGKLLNRGEKYA
jgi:uncharacterized membrane protein